MQGYRSRDATGHPHPLSGTWVRTLGLVAVALSVWLMAPQSNASPSPKARAKTGKSTSATSRSPNRKRLRHTPKARHQRQTRRRVSRRGKRRTSRKRRKPWIPPYLRYVKKKYTPYDKKMKRYALINNVNRRGYPYHRRRIRSISSLKKLQRDLRRLLRHRWLRGAKLGLVVMTSKGKTLFAHNARKLFIPASNVKLLTIAAAIHYLGPHYRFATKIYSDKPIDKDGVIQGNLYIKGSGDPSLRSEELWRICRDLYLRGLRKITGRIYIDTSLFDDVHFGPGWEDHAVQKGERYRPYMAPVGALSLNYNVMGLSIRPAQKVGQTARVALDPRSYYVRKLVNKVKTVASGRFGIRVKMLSHRNWRERVVIKGQIPLHSRPRMTWRRVSHPDWYAGFQFARALREQRIRVNQWPRRRKVPSHARVLYRHYSAPLGSILQYAGKISSNFTTEQVTKLMGAKVYGKPGTWAKGINAVRSYLKSLGISPKGYKLINGSGLSRGNRLYPMLLATLLQKQLHSLATRPDFIVAQPIAGYDGTLRWRMKRSTASGVLRAKTGTLDGVSSLSGYVQTVDNKLLIFAINMNGRKRQVRYFRRIQNRIGKLLARYKLGSN